MKISWTTALLEDEDDKAKEGKKREGKGRRGKAMGCRPDIQSELVAKSFLQGGVTMPELGYPNPVQ